MPIFRGTGLQFIEQDTKALLTGREEYYITPEKQPGYIKGMEFLWNSIQGIANHCVVFIETEIPEIKSTQFYRADGIVVVFDGNVERVFHFEFKSRAEVFANRGIVSQILEYRRILENAGIRPDANVFKTGGAYLQKSFLVAGECNRSEAMRTLNISSTHPSISVFGNDVDFVFNRMLPKRSDRDANDTDVTRYTDLLVMPRLTRDVV